MKLTSFSHQGVATFGAVCEAGIVDLGSVFSNEYCDLKEFIAAGDEALQRAAQAISSAPLIAQAAVEFLPVIPNPGTIWCAGMNTHSHYHEAKDFMHLKELPAHPILFLRSPATLIGSGQELEKPKLEPAFDYEGEIALVIGKRARNLSVEEALSVIAGYAPFNDASARKYQTNASQITAGKNAYRSGGFGPWMSTPDEVDLESMTMICRVNGTELQRMPLNDLIFGFAELISYISEFTWLEPGDVIVTGSPEGIGALRKPPVLLQAGDTVEVEVTGVGTLLNGVREQQV